MIPVDQSANCDGRIYDTNGSWIQILGIRSRDPFSGSTDMSDSIPSSGTVTHFRPHPEGTQTAPRPYPDRTQTAPRSHPDRTHLNSVEPVVGLDREAVVGLWRLDGVLLEEGRVFLQVLLRKPSADLKRRQTG